MKPEQQLQKQLCLWLRIQYPSVYFMSDASGLPISSWGLRHLLKNTRSKHAGLDIIILEPRGDYYHGLVLELKAISPFKVDGTLKTDIHLFAQQQTINHLSGKGYFCCFVWNFDSAILIIKKYLGKNK